MTLVELKKSIHDGIEDLNDQDFLQAVKEMISHYKDEVFVVPEHMKEGIRQGREDVKNGRVHTMEDFDKKYEKWLKE